jgi:hypothetical protein
LTAFRVPSRFGRFGLCDWFWLRRDLVCHSGRWRQMGEFFDLTGAFEGVVVLRVVKRRPRVRSGGFGHLKHGGR